MANESDETQQILCAYCGKKKPAEEMSDEHVLPWAISGGGFTPSQ